MGTNNNQGPEPNTQAGMSQTYIDKLKEDLNAARSRFNELSKAASKAHVEYNLSAEWKTDLGDYIQRVEKTYNQVIDLDKAIVSLVNHSHNVCTNVDLSGKAVVVLANCLKCLVEEIEALKQLLKDLLDALDCLNDPVLDPNVSIMKCLVDLHDKVKAAIAAGLTAIDKVLALCQRLLSMEYLICREVNLGQDPEGGGDTDESQGLVYDLEQLRKVLCCDYCGGFPETSETRDWCNTQDDYPLPEGCCPDPVNDPDCMDQIEKPALCNGGFGSSFYTKLCEDHQQACDLAEFKKCAWQTYEDQKQMALTKHDAIKAALEAAEGAKAKCN